MCTSAHVSCWLYSFTSFKLNWTWIRLEWFSVTCITSKLKWNGNVVPDFNVFWRLLKAVWTWLVAHRKATDPWVCINFNRPTDPHFWETLYGDTIKGLIQARVNNRFDSGALKSDWHVEIFQAWLAFCRLSAKVSKFWVVLSWFLHVR